MEKSAILKNVKLWHSKILNLHITSQQIGLQDLCIRSSQASGLQQRQNMPRSTSTMVRQSCERCSHWEEPTAVDHSVFSHKGNFLQQSSTSWLGLGQIQLKLGKLVMPHMCLRIDTSESQNNPDATVIGKVLLLLLLHHLLINEFCHYSVILQ